MSLSVSITVNGHRYDRDIEPRLLLVHFLRDTLGLTVDAMIGVGGRAY